MRSHGQMATAPFAVLKLLLGPLVTVGLGASLAVAQPSPAPQPAGQQAQQAKAPLSDKDKDFIHKLAKGGALQIELSKVEVQKGQDPKIRRFALETVENMSKAGGMLHALAKSFGIELPQQPPEDVQKLRDGLAADQGKLVDSEYIAQILPASTVAVNVFKDEVDNGKNPKLMDFAKQMLPKLEKHQQMAVQISQSGAKSAGKQPSPSATTGNAPGANPQPGSPPLAPATGKPATGKSAAPASAPESSSPPQTGNPEPRQ